MTTPAELANRLLDLVVAVLSDLEAAHAPELELPRVHGGYLVHRNQRRDRAGSFGVDMPCGALGDDSGGIVSDVAAELGCDWHTLAPLLAADCDLAFTLSLLHEAGVEHVAGLPCADSALEIVRQLDGATTHSFYSYRAAETLLRFGGLDANPALRNWSEADIANVAEAIDSSSMLEALAARKLPNNYAVVLTRCEFDRYRLGRLPDETVLDGLVSEVSGLFTQLPTG